LSLGDDGISVTYFDDDGSEAGTTDRDPLTYEEIAVGDRFEADRTVTFSRESIVEFAAEYDPQPFHLDEAAGEASPFGGLVASGLQTLCACSRLSTEAFFGRIAFLGGRGIDDLRWHRPVRPGDSLSVDVVVANKRPSESNPERGYVDADVTGSDTEGNEVLSWHVLGMVRRGPATSSASG
jgi:acyl dehydratase